MLQATDAPAGPSGSLVLGSAASGSPAGQPCGGPPWDGPPWSLPPRPLCGSRLASASRRFAKARAQARLAYPGDVAAQALGDLLVGLVGVLFLSALFARVPHVAGWSLHETLVVWGLAECVSALTSCVCAGAAVFNQRYLLGGELDRMLLRPLALGPGLA